VTAPSDLSPGAQRYSTMRSVVDDEALIDRAIACDRHKTREIMAFHAFKLLPWSTAEDGEAAFAAMLNDLKSIPGVQPS
jgi:hypothetical protein